ncbi:hypothetical protein DSL72_006448 [Monilinia vaccinii-corymbosi]|uniref:Uncharacterized protein n=1 Tax=Monilinia vaccinii-corymbosi TaxID=61207 RepID=A0A8A3PMF6_9HELO|nr:hypothetical protein DSL72_006448 [Monilinia vaccinii-corymbosi]
MFEKGSTKTQAKAVGCMDIHYCPLGSATICPLAIITSPGSVCYALPADFAWKYVLRATVVLAKWYRPHSRHSINVTPQVLSLLSTSPRFQAPSTPRTPKLASWSSTLEEVSFHNRSWHPMNNSSAPPSRISHLVSLVSDIKSIPSNGGILAGVSMDVSQLHIYAPSCCVSRVAQLAIPSVRSLAHRDQHALWKGERYNPTAYLDDAEFNRRNW